MRLYCSAVQGELLQAGGYVSIQVSCFIGRRRRHVGMHVRQQEMTRALYVFRKSSGQARSTPFLEREPRSFHQQPADILLVFTFVYRVIRQTFFLEQLMYHLYILYDPSRGWIINISISNIVILIRQLF